MQIRYRITSDVTHDWSLSSLKARDTVHVKKNSTGLSICGYGPEDDQDEVPELMMCETCKMRARGMNLLDIIIIPDRS